jgi:nicotinate-nucleotide adenylyltransferase
LSKIGIMGGTFDPPHFGHLLIAEQAREACQLDEVWFMPTKTPPHKTGSNLCEDEQRIEMVRRAIKTNPNYKLSLVEFERKGRSYTIDTIKELKTRYNETNFYFIIGGDMIEYLAKWKDIDELLTLITFVGVKRPGHTCHSIYNDKVVIIDAPQLEISSSEIRDRLFNNRSIRYLLPDTVLDYIKEQGIYGQS